jgi:hypothetical protein
VLGVAMSKERVALCEAIPKSRSRKVNGYVKCVLALEAIQQRRAARFKRYIRGRDQVKAR